MSNNVYSPPIEIVMYVEIPINETDTNEDKNLKNIINGILHEDSLIPLWKQVKMCEQFGIKDYIINIKRIVLEDGYKNITYKKFIITETHEDKIKI